MSASALRHFWVAIAILVVAISACRSPQQAGGTVTPHARVFFTRSERNFDVAANLGPVTFSRAPIDVALIFDRTSSMSGVIREAQARAVELLGGIVTMYPNAAFAVAGLADFDSAWTLYQDVTQNRSAVTAGLFQITEESGRDYPEAYARALQEVRELSWRPGAARYVVIFGDAPAKGSAGFYGTDFGVDLGRDGIAGTTDDPQFEAAVSALRGDSITILAVYDGSSAKPYRKETMRGFEFMARETGGIAVPLSAAADVVDVIRQSLQRMIRPTPAHVVPAAYAAWVATSPFERKAPGTNVFTAPVAINPPDDTPAGVYRFPLTVMTGLEAEADTVGRAWVTVRVGMAAFPWRVPLLLAYVLGLAVLAMVRSPGDVQQFSLYSTGRPFIGFLRNGVITALIIGFAVAVWKVAPGTLPPPPAAVGRDPVPSPKAGKSIAATGQGAER